MANRSLKLDDARRMTPPVSPAEALRQSLHATLLAQFSGDDVREMAGKLKEAALKGDKKAMQMVIQLISTAPPAARGGAVGVVLNPAEPNGNGHGKRPLPALPCPHRPGTAEHAGIVALRLERGEQPTHPADEPALPPSPAEEALRSRQAQLARALAEVGPRTLKQLDREGFPADAAICLLRPPYFIERGGMWSLTESGRLTLLGQGKRASEGGEGEGGDE